ncbi:MAG: UDP-N-acetylmuramate-L-alanine ligase [Candidatus Nomurabacteria bacterium GW2011_GWA2_43_15]|uniref:UDP-N-acetylmuramate-L-alanine ligase n=1 Tax=Candidatus Nomurabacteria bacterium GW2011_GWA2_43_15 TaxID=1618738 RepID=A0A0G1FW57_9BACT|nr:MAG: UDP-N-acetylmuramate-L-alanine ligase [Candidatus Nomurabacteria bacterium GW2011_GWA2_43_15]
MNLDLSKINTSEILSARKIFFIGIGGIGISALAKMAISKGIEVSGVNDEESSKTLEPLRELGVEIIMSRGILDSLPEADLYVYSDAWLIPSDCYCRHPWQNHNHGNGRRYFNGS